MRKYQIIEVSPDKNNAGSKAPNDIYKIASNLQFENISLTIPVSNRTLGSKIKNQGEFSLKWRRIYSKVEKNSILLLQYPTYERQLGRFHYLKRLHEKKKVKFITIVHDVNELRNLKTNNELDHEFWKIVKLSDQVILHNTKMIDYFVNHKQIDPGRINNIEIFDYLMNTKVLSFPKFSRQVIIAGNLNLEKSGYLSGLSSINNPFILYGSNINKSVLSKNVEYGGSKSPEKLYKYLNKGFGLIWDGSSTKTCVGDYGTYLKYNNPHKLSLYLVHNMPVFIWKQAAEAEFVKKNKVGILINSIEDIPSILDDLNEKKYYELVENVSKVSKRLARGTYTASAINKAINKIEK